MSMMIVIFSSWEYADLVVSLKEASFIGFICTRIEL